MRTRQMPLVLLVDRKAYDNLWVSSPVAHKVAIQRMAGLLTSKEKHLDFCDGDNLKITSTRHLDQGCGVDSCSSPQ